jgi:transcriptional regulator with XRE-family HTH domain
MIITGGCGMDIGSKLKELRVLKGLTQEELADRAELSKGFISQVERNLTSPSIATLMDILQCLGTSTAEFFAEPPEEQVVFGKADYFEKYDTELKNEIKWIIPNAQKNRMEPILLTLEAGGQTYPDTPHEGEEFGYVLSGLVAIHLGNATYRAKKGESFYFTPDKQHYLTSKTGATLIWVSSPPSF